jgi:Uma2 family endonuclease
MRYSVHGRAAHLAEDGLAMLMANATKIWTLEELHSLPDDGNKYELVRGALFVTPPPSLDHETIGARLHRILAPYVEEQKLGEVFRPRAVVRAKGSEAEPDLMVWKPDTSASANWDSGPPPILLVEILSPSTRRRDRQEKREFYLDDCRADEYWIVDPEDSTITRVRAGEGDVIARAQLDWHPREASRALTVQLSSVFIAGEDM